MKKLILFFLLATFVFEKPLAQTQTPGLDVLGYGYDVFGNFADQKSKKRYCLFKYTNFSETPIGSFRYSVPQYVFLENISNHIVKTVSGESIRDYARSLSAEAGFSGETMFFKGSVNSSYSQSTSGNEQKFFYTYMDANTKWRVSFDERDLPLLNTILDPRFKQDLETLDPEKLFETYGTHYVASAYLGGRADFSSESVISSQTKTQEISVAVEASYKAVSANAKLDTKYSQTLSNAKTTTKLTVTGGNSQFANNISDPESYRLWAEGIEKMPVLCDFDKNSLKPIWDFCTNPVRKAALIETFRKLCEKNPLPAAFANLSAVKENAYMIKNKATGLFFDFPEFNPRNAKAGDKLTLGSYDNNTIKNQGFDRVYRFENCETEPEFVYIRPQHSNMVLDITGGTLNTGTPIHIWELNKTSAQTFKLQPVDGEPNTFFIKTKNDLCLEPSSNKSEVILGQFNAGENQKWKFEDFDPKNIAQPANGAYTIQCVAGGNYWDFPGTYPEINDNKLNLWTPGNAIGDRTIKIEAKGQYFTLRPNFHPTNLLTSESKTRLYTSQGKAADNQLYTFEYSGTPNAYIIRNKSNNEVISADGGQTNVAGCSVNSWPMNGGENERWWIHGPKPGQTPIHEGTYYVRVEKSNKYWDLSGVESDTNKNGVKAIIWDNDGGYDRKIQFIPCDNDLGYYSIKFGNARFLDVSGNWNISDLGVIDGAKYRSGASDIKLKKDKGAKLQCYEWTGNDAQKFKIVYVGNNAFSVVSKIENHAVDVSGGKINDNGPDLQLWDWDRNNVSQRFVLISTKDNQQYIFE